MQRQPPPSLPFSKTGSRAASTSRLLSNSVFGPAFKTLFLLRAEYTEVMRTWKRCSWSHWSTRHALRLLSVPSTFCVGCVFLSTTGASAKWWKHVSRSALLGTVEYLYNAPFMFAGGVISRTGYVLLLKFSMYPFHVVAVLHACVWDLLFFRIYVPPRECKASTWFFSFFYSRAFC